MTLAAPPTATFHHMRDGTPEDWAVIARITDCP